MAGDGFKIPLIPYVNGTVQGSRTVVAANGGYARYANLAAAKSFWDDAPTAGDKGSDLFPAPSAAIITVTTQDIRIRTVTAPTASEGVLWAASGSPVFFENNLDFLKALKAIEVTTTAEVTIQWLYQW